MLILKVTVGKVVLSYSTVVIRVEPEDKSLIVLYLSKEQSVSILKLTYEQDVYCTSLSTVAANFYSKGNCCVCCTVPFCVCCHCRF
jgi:hypothetical protein